MSILGRDFKICEVFGGWGVNTATNSGCCGHGWETCHPCWVNSGRRRCFFFFFVEFPCCSFQGESIVAEFEFKELGS